jgi:hypothetical protein
LIMGDSEHGIMSLTMTVADIKAAYLLKEE